MFHHSSHLSIVRLVFVEEVHELLEEEALGVDLLVDSLVNAVDDEGDGAHQARLQHAAVALVPDLDLRRLVDHGVGAGVKKLSFTSKLFKANLNQHNINLPRVPDWNSLHEHSHLRGEFEDVGEWQVPQIDVPGDRWLQSISISISWRQPLARRKRVRA